MRNAMVLVAIGALFGCGDGPDEWTCELEVNGATVCVDGNSRSYCESDWGGIATASEKEPGGPFEYCADLYAVSCTGRLIETGEDFTAEHSYYAETEEDCAAAAGGAIGG